MAKTFETLKGTYDYLPSEQSLRESIKDRLKDVFKRYGFLPAETPILSMLDLLTSKYSSDADILNEIYKLSDQGKRELGLRYDLTICLTKLISSNRGISLPFKRYEIGKVFRDGPVKLGRNREFTQCDVDVVGVSSILQEAEFMNLTHEAYSELGLEVEIRYNNRKILYGIIKSIFGEMSDELLRSVVMLVDKLDKMTKEELEREFIKLGLSSKSYDELYNSFSMSYEDLKAKYENSTSEILKEGFLEMDELRALTTSTPAWKSMLYAPYLARGIDIYTGTVWEIFLKERNIGEHDFNLSLGGGGRYDNIITSFIDDGNSYPAVGMSFGLDVIYEVLKAKEGDEKKSDIDLFIIPLETKKDSFIFTQGLRTRGIKADIEKVDRRVKKSLNYANKEHIPFVVIIGEDEVKNRMINIKDMTTGEETPFSLDDYEGICEFINKRL